MTTAAPNASSTHSKPFIAGKSIVISGAGVSGLAFVVALSQQWNNSWEKPKITILERDSYDDRVGREGYTLSLRTDSRSGGIQALDRMGIYEKIASASVFGEGEGGGSFVIWDRNWEELMKVTPGPVGPKKLHAMRIRRNALQRVLADAASEAGADLKWSTAVDGVEQLDTGRMRVKCIDGTSLECDLLIAADGSKSKVRTLLRPKDGLDFAGVVMMMGTGKFETEEDVPKPMNKNWGLILGGDGKGVGCFTSPVDTHSALWSVSYYAKEPRQPAKHPIPEAKYEALMTEAKDLGKDFPPEFHQLLEATDPTTFNVLNTMDRPPFSHDIARDGPVIWIGDANHAVSPFAGNGANMALMDAWDLAEALCQAQSLESGVKAYEKLFIPRTRSTLKMSRWNIGMFHMTGLKLWLFKLVARTLRFFAVKLGR